MAMLRDMRDRIEALEERECECECDGGSGWPEAGCWIAFWLALALAAWATAYSTVNAPAETPKPHPSVECIKAGGEWSGWGYCKKAQ
jgi:hypothetical protein